MNRNILLKQLDTVETLASSRWRRLLRHPFRYVYAILFAKFIYPNTKREIRKNAPLFYSEMMQVDLPAATDIYLTGGKSHPSEIRLARFLILNLSPGSRFLDIGAHYGYFSLLASKITGATGKVFAFEPSDNTFALLRENSIRQPNITTFKKAVSDTPGMLTFFQFPTLYSEYNSTNAEQFRNEAWFTEFKPIPVEVPATTIDAITEGGGFIPDLIKMDVEGAEHKAMLGGVGFLKAHAPVLIMEYLHPARKNEEHKKAVSLLRELGYQSYAIRHSGETERLDDIDEYLDGHRLDSDNIVFRKHTGQ